MENPSIAIIIPAYKPTYLRQTLESLVNQTDQNFSVYIGDDNSPSNLYEIIAPFESKLQLTYRKFEVNLGGSDLVAQWNRCLGLMRDEEWFILFSDDDLMEPDCIAGLRKEIEKDLFDVYHFNLKVIDSEGGIISEPFAYPKVMSSMDFFNMLYRFQIDARMPEFVFRKSHFIRKGGFIPFDLAMRTDNATVINCAFEKGIKTVGNAYVLWRDSGNNVSSGQQSREKHEKFYKALVDFFNWVEAFCAKNNCQIGMSQTEKLTFLYNQGYNMRKSIGLANVFQTMKEYTKFPHGILIILAFSKVFIQKAIRKIPIKRMRYDM